MKIYIAKTHTGEPLGLLLSESMDYAQVAFEAMNTKHYSIEEIDTTDIPGGKVFYILTSKEATAHRQAGKCDPTYRKWKRGK